MNLRLKRWITAGATLAMVATMGLSACSTNRALSSETGKNEVTMASRTPNWIFPISAKGYTQGENGQFIQSLYRPLFAYKSTSETPYKINLPKSLGQVPDVSEDGKTYTITLRDDAKWSDGTAVSTRDIEFWWNLVTNNKDQWASYKEGFFPDGASLAVLDEHTFSITTTDAFNPSWFIDNQINKVALLPQHAWDKTSADEAVSDLDRTPEGAQAVFAYLQGEAKDLSSYAKNPLWQTVNGPWKLSSFTPDQGLELVPNENYWGEDKPKIDKLIYKAFTGDDAEFNSVRSGAIDFGYIPAASYNQRSAVESKGYNVFLWPGNTITYLALNFAPQAPGSKFINQKYIRQAMQQLIDQPTLSEKIWSGTASPTCGPVPMPADKVGTTDGCVYKFDPDAAKKLLEDHGWKVVPDGSTTCENPGTGDNQCGEGIEAGDALSFKLISQSGFVSTHQMFEEIISQFGKLGIKIDMNEVPDSVGASQACDDETPCTWDLSFFGSQTSWGFPIYASGERLFATDAPVNLGQYSNPEADKLIEESTRSTEPDALQAYNDFLAEDLPVLWMPNPYYQITAVKNTLDLGELDATGDTWPEDWAWKTDGAK